MEEDRITADTGGSKPPKNPKRVAAGKALAERNKKAREQQHQPNEEGPSKFFSWLSLEKIIAIGTFGIGLYSVYLQHISSKKTVTKPPPQIVSKPRILME